MKALNIKSESDFFKYVYYGQIDNVKESLKDNPDLLESQTITGGQMSPLLVAAHKGCFNVLSFLIKKGANLSARAHRSMELMGDGGMSIFDFVSENGDKNCLRIIKNTIKDGVYINQNVLSKSMRFALRNNHYDYLSFYLETFENSHLFWSNDPFGELARTGNFKGIVKLKELANKYNTSLLLLDPIHLNCLTGMALEKGYTSTAIKIIEHFELNPSNLFVGPSQDPLLHVALENNQLESFLTLYKRFPDISLARVNLQGATLLHYGAKRLDSFKDLEQLIKLCCDEISPYAQDVNGRTIMHYAAKSGKLDTVLELGKRYPRLKFSLEDKSGFNSYGHILNLFLGLTEINEHSLFQKYFSKMIAMQGMSLNTIEKLAQSFISSASSEYYKVQAHFQFLFNFFSFMFKKSVSSYEGMKEYFNFFSCGERENNVDLQVLLGLPIKNTQGKTLLDVLIEKGNSDALTLYLKEMYQEESPMNSNALAVSTNTDRVENDEEPEPEGPSGFYNILLKSIKVNLLNDMQLRGLHLAFARCGVQQSIQFAFSNEKVINTILKSASSKHSPFAKEDQQLLLDGLVHDELFVQGQEAKILNIKSRILFSQKEINGQVDGCKDTQRDMIIILAKKLKDREVLCKYLDMPLKLPTQDSAVGNNPCISTSESLLFLLTQKINQQNEKLKTLKEKLAGLNSNGPKPK